MAVMRIAGEVIKLEDKTPAPEPKAKRTRAKKPSVELQHPIKLRLNPDHVLFELGL